MSQQHPGRRRRRVSRGAASFLAPVLAGGLLIAYGPPALAAPTATRAAPADSTSYTAGTYLVTLADAPVATAPGTAPAQGERLDTGDKAVREYVGRLKRERDDVLAEVPGVKPLYGYQYVLNGFAARLTAGQAKELARTPGVASVVRNEIRQLIPRADGDTTAPTTPSPTTGTSSPASASTPGALPAPDTAEFLGLKTKRGLYSKFRGGQRNAGQGVIVGVIDSGIDTASPSLAALPEPRPDAEVIEKKWKGSCDPGEAAPGQVVCNNKVIGAQYFAKGLGDTGEDVVSPLDSNSHGTHTATTAAGNMDVPATVPDTGIVDARISGVAPGARVAGYKVCWAAGCSTADIVAAYDKAVADGVDVINYSMGTGAVGSTTAPDHVAMFNAAKAGVFIAASAGNSGPGVMDNGLPWVTTVAASTHDLGYRTTLTLGDGTSYDGVGAGASGLPSAPLVDGAKAARQGVDAVQAARCMADSLDPAKVEGAVVICARGGNGRTAKSDAVRAAGGADMVLYYTGAGDEAIVDAHTIPASYLDRAAGEAVKAYAEKAGGAATASLGAGRAVEQRAPRVAGFSSSGPEVASGGDLLKPDLTAPGVDVVAGTVAGGHGIFKGRQGVMSGTSMSAPHVAGLAALLRSLHPDWSPMEVKSALMTTATTKDNAGKAIARSNTSAPATPLDYGAGHVVPNSADDPGLVYDSTSADWTSYICAVGGRPVTEDSGDGSDGGDVCAGARKIDASDFNNPTIAVGDLAGKQTVTRTVTNIGGERATYSATLRTPPGYRAEVSPKRFTVAAGGSATYKVTFTRTSAAYGDWSYGSVSWSDRDGHRVRSAVALRAAPLTVPKEIAGQGSTGSLALPATPGWDGTLTTTVDGLYEGTVKTGTLTGAAPDFDPAQSPLPEAVARTEITVPEGTDLARIAIRSSEHLADGDLDLWVLDENGDLLSDPSSGNDEHLDLTEPGTYTVYVVQYRLPPGTDSQPYTLHTWLIGDDTRPDRPATVNPAEQPASMGTATEVELGWSGLASGGTYLGLVRYGDGTRTEGTTVVTVTP
ncbi:S8 family serine peptidase [Streptomyces sp. NPDC002643]